MGSPRCFGSDGGRRDIATKGGFGDIEVCASCDGFGGHDPVPPNDEWVPRFGITERLTHWWTMLMIATALLTGAGLGDDGDGPLLITHVLAVALIGVGLVVAVLVGDRRALLRAARRLFRFDQRDATRRG